MSNDPNNNTQDMTTPGGNTRGDGAIEPSRCKVVLEVSGAMPMDYKQAQSMHEQMTAWLNEPGLVRRNMDNLVACGARTTLEGWDCMGECLPAQDPVLVLSQEGVATAQSARFRLTLADPDRVRRGALVGARAIHARMEETLVAKVVGKSLQMLGLRDFAEETKINELASAQAHICLHMTLLALECGAEVLRDGIARAALPVSFSLIVPGVPGPLPFDLDTVVARRNERVMVAPRRGVFKP